MSDLVDTIINDISENLQYEPSLLIPDAHPIETTAVIKHWLASARVAAELEGLIDLNGRLTPRGYMVVLRLSNYQPVPGFTVQRILQAGALSITTQATFLLINHYDPSYTTLIVNLSDEERIILSQLGITDEGGNLTRLGVDLACDLRWGIRR